MDFKVNNYWDAIIVPKLCHIKKFKVITMMSYIKIKKNQKTNFHPLGTKNGYKNKYLFLLNLN